jgi:hypothetical protein
MLAEEHACMLVVNVHKLVVVNIFQDNTGHQPISQKH